MRHLSHQSRFLRRPSVVEAASVFASSTARRAGRQDQGLIDLSSDLTELHELGLLMAPLPESEGGESLGHGIDSVDKTIAVLTMIGNANLSLARLYEGHINALKLIDLYGTSAQRQECCNLAHDGVMYGVWGADGRQPARIAGDGGLLHLEGGKRFASGAGTLGRAVVPVEDMAGGQQLLILDVSDRRRADPAAWTASGMRASQSGNYDLTGMAIDRSTFLGLPGDYMREPWFLGGIWRCAAAQLGAVERIVEETRRHLEAAGRLGDAIQLQRLGRSIMAARSARLWIRDAALKVEAALNVTEAVAAASMARLVVEEAGNEVIRLAQRSIGLAAFSTTHPAERVCRDLEVYLRQAAPDALLQNSTCQLLSLDRPLPGFADPIESPAWCP